MFNIITETVDRSPSQHIDLITLQFSIKLSGVDFVEKQNLNGKLHNAYFHPIEE